MIFLVMEIKYLRRKRLTKKQLDYYVNTLRRPIYACHELRIVKTKDGRWLLYTTKDFECDEYSGSVYLGIFTEEQIDEYNSVFSDDDIVKVRFDGNGESDDYNASMNIFIKADDWECPDCGTVNSIEEDKRCQHCGHIREVVSKGAEKWNCCICGNNDNVKSFCSKCGVLKEYEDKVVAKINEIEKELSDLKTEDLAIRLENESLKSECEQMRNINRARFNNGRRKKYDDEYEREVEAIRRDYEAQRVAYENYGITSDEYEFED